MLRARGMLWASQVAPGTENGLKLRVYGDKGGLEWSHETPETLWFTPFGQPAQKLRRNGPGTVPGLERFSRTPTGHPEGYLEGFANLYAEAAMAIRARQADAPVPEGVAMPGVEDGLEGLFFIDACIRSSAQNAAFVKVMP